MARAKRPIAVGDVYSFPLSGGNVGLCHVIAVEKPRGKLDVSGRHRVVLCEWGGPRKKIAAALTSATAMRAMKMTRPGGKPSVQSIAGSPPRGLVLVGTVAPSAADRKIRGASAVGAFQWFRWLRSRELAYREDPVRVERLAAAHALARAKARAKRLEALREEAKRRRAEKLRPIDTKALRALARTESLAKWTAHHGAVLVREVRAVLSSLARGLVASPPKGAGGARTALIRATSAIDRIDALHDHAITTPDAEDLVAALVAIGVAAGLTEASADDAVDSARRF